MLERSEGREGVPLLLGVSAVRGAGSVPPGIPPKKRQTLPTLQLQKIRFLEKMSENSSHVAPELLASTASLAAESWGGQLPP